MKKILVAAAALLMTTAVVHAQTTQEKPIQHKGFHNRAKGLRGKDGFAKLNLTDAQKKQVKDLNDNYRKQFADLKKNSGMTVGDYRAKTTALRKEQREKLQSVLTPDQKKQLADQHKAMGQKMKMAQTKRFDNMKTKLGLSEEQANKLKESQAGTQSKIKSIREDKSLTDEQKKEQVKTIFKQQREQLKSVLTPEQLQKMKSGRKNRTDETK